MFLITGPCLFESLLHMNKFKIYVLNKFTFTFFHEIRSCFKKASENTFKKSHINIILTHKKGDVNHKNCNWWLKSTCFQDSYFSSSKSILIMSKSCSRGQFWWRDSLQQVELHFDHWSVGFVEKNKTEIRHSYINQCDINSHKFLWLNIVTGTVQGKSAGKFRLAEGL